MTHFKKKIIFGIYLFLSLVSIRYFILNPGTLGHNWDWFVPSSLIYLQNLPSTLFYTWRNFSLGEPISLWLPSAPFFLFFTGFSFLGFGGGFISKLLVISSILLSSFGMFLLINKLVNKQEKKSDFPAFLAGLFYGFSPFLLCEFIGGAATQFFAYSLIPWFFYFFSILNEKNNNHYRFYLLASAVFFSFLTISLQVIILCSFLLFASLVIQEDKTKYLKNLFFLFILYCLLNFYWILPTIVEFQNIFQTVGAGSAFSDFTIRNLVPSLDQAWANIGYTRPFYPALISNNLYPFWLFIVYLGLSFIFWKVIAGKRKEAVFWLFIFLFSLIFSTGGKDPLGNQVLWLYEHLFLMSFFRSPQHFILLSVFSMAILIGHATVGVDFKNYIKRILFIAFFVIWLYPFFSGDFGSSILHSKKMEYIDSYKLSPGYEKAFEIIHQDEGDHKMLFLPLSGSPKFLKTEYQNENQGGDPLIEYSIKDTVVTDISYASQGKDLVLELERIFCDKKNQEKTSDIVSGFNVKYLLLRKDVIPHFSECQTWNWQDAYLKLKVEGYAEIFSQDYVILFENNKYLPHLYSPQKNTTISFTKINPTRYEVQVDNPADSFDLIFLESYNSSWKIFPEKINDFAGQLFSKPLYANSHRKINGFANGWKINKNGSYRLLLVYIPQNYLYLGSVVSALALLFMFLLIINKELKFAKEKHDEYNL